MPHACQLIISLKAYIFNIIGTKACILSSCILHIYVWSFFFFLNSKIIEDFSGTCMLVTGVIPLFFSSHRISE